VVGGGFKTRPPSSHPWRPNLSEHEDRHLLEHENEPPEIRVMYEAELKKEYIPLRMKPIERPGKSLGNHSKQAG
jgi:hypothetical protein